jgi:hypothetical protein
MLTKGNKYFNDDLENDLIGLRTGIFMANELFEQVVLPHLDAAYNLARWLAGNDHDAQDVAQEASLRSSSSEVCAAKTRGRGCSRLSAIHFTTG